MSASRPGSKNMDDAKAPATPPRNAVAKKRRSKRAETDCMRGRNRLYRTARAAACEDEQVVCILHVHMSALILITLIFVVCSGIVACVDAAILSVTRGEIAELALRNAWGSCALKQVTRHMTRAVVVIVIVTNTINVVGPIVIGHTAALLFGSSVLGIVTGVLAFLTIVFSEIIP